LQKRPVKAAAAACGMQACGRVLCRQPVTAVCCSVSQCVAVCCSVVACEACLRVLNPYSAIGRHTCMYIYIYTYIYICIYTYIYIYENVLTRQLDTKCKLLSTYRAEWSSMSRHSQNSARY